MDVGQTEFLVWNLAGLCSVSAIVLSVRLIRQHMASFSSPSVQSKIIGILWMVPIYAFDSWISLRFPPAAIYLDMLRDCYEAYVLYLFLALMVAYIGDGNERRVISVLEAQPPVYHMFPFSIVYRESLPTGAEFLRWCKFGTLQYSIIKPLTTFLAIVLEISGGYHETNFDPRYGYLYITIAVNMSVFYAVYVLLIFYMMLKTPLSPYQPVPKFMCVKAVIFFSFWQGVVVAGLTNVHVILFVAPLTFLNVCYRIDIISSIGAYTASDVSKGLQDLLICVEMLVASIAHMYAFPATPFQKDIPVDPFDYSTSADPLLTANHPKVKGGLFNVHFASDTAIRDFNQVMPVLLPSHFSPGAPLTSTRIPEGRRGYKLEHKYAQSNENDDATSQASERPTESIASHNSHRRKSYKRLRNPQQKRRGVQRLFGRQPDNEGQSSMYEIEMEADDRSNEAAMETKHDIEQPASKTYTIPKSAQPTLLLLSRKSPSFRSQSQDESDESS